MTALAGTVRTTRWLRPAGYVLIAAAAVYLVVSLWAVIRADAGAGDDLAGRRDELTRTAVRQITQLNTVDPQRADLDLAHWLEISTGPFHDALKQDMAAARATFAKQNAPARGRVTALAVTALDADAGEATVIASVRVFLSTPGAGTEQRKRYQVGMERAGGGWKVKTLTALAPGGRS
ncbi:hypothetical protein [Actinomadura xylanilytica]|uniref:hypothetical protein n=1 Tax=Actinomadura xylanilytica TaxID=887459 RepID=UPI00255AFC5E|nr:hypothetical protein [Actinomadura xylanilytica]MDL4775583.1 hypothetical protein [Actinomadura xylanilytica]